jgi:HEAT repeat protein
MTSTRSLLRFGVLSLTVSVTLSLLIVVTGVVLMVDHWTPLGDRAWAAVTFAALAAGLACVVLAGLQFVQLAASLRAARRIAAAEARWTEDLLAWAYADVPLPCPLNRVGAEVLLKLRDSLRGSVSDRLRDLYAETGWLTEDLRRLALPRLPIVARAQAIERLALLRHPLALKALDRELGHPHPEVRALALLALSRSVGRLSLSRREGLVQSLALHEAITRGSFSFGQVQEALSLLDDAGLLLCRDLLAGENDRLKVCTLEVLARRHAADLHSEVVPLLSSPNAEVRSAALKVLHLSGLVPPAAGEAIRALLRDPAPFVQLNAVLASAHLNPPPLEDLWTLLGAPDWWVRRAAARMLLAQPDGRTRLMQAQSGHPDRYARDMARDTLAGSVPGPLLPAPATPAALLSPPEQALVGRPERP